MEGNLQTMTAETLADVNQEVWLHTEDDEDGIIDVEDVADIISISDSKTRVVYMDGDSELLDGWVFQVKGYWKVWLDTAAEIEKWDHVKKAMTMPHGAVKVYGPYRTPEVLGKSIKRAKRADL